MSGSSSLMWSLGKGKMCLGASPEPSQQQLWGEAPAEGTASQKATDEPVLPPSLGGPLPNMAGMSEVHGLVDNMVLLQLLKYVILV